MTPAAAIPKKHRAGPSSFVTCLMSGGAAGGIAKTVVAPLDRVKILHQVSSSKKFTFYSVLRYAERIVTTEGILGLWKGHSATMLRVLPYSAIQYTAFDEYKQLWVSRFGPSSDSSDISNLGRFLSGSCAGLTSVLATYPLDMLRSRLAVDQSSQRLGLLWWSTKSLFEQRGLWAYYTGLLPSLIGIIPYAGTSFWTFETLKSAWRKRYGNDSFTPSAKLLCGGCAGLLGQSVAYPLEIVRRRMQVQGMGVTPGNDPRPYRMLRLVSTIYQQEGLFGGLYKGLTMNWVKGPIAAGISFTVYETIRSSTIEGYLP